MKPNIIFILSDQHSSSIMANAGNDIVRTPNLDTLARNGVAFDNCYCPSPVCIPSRMSLLTGLLPQDNGICTNQQTLNSSDITIAHRMTNLGYESVLVGRMDFRSYDQFHGFEKHLVGDITSDYPCHNNLEEVLGDLKDTMAQGVSAVKKTGAGHTVVQMFDEDVTQGTIDFLKDREDDRPLFLTVGLFAPHNPFVAEKELYDYYYDRVSTEQKEGTNHPFEVRFKENRNLNEVNEDDLKRTRAAYYGLVEYLDRNIGRILEQVVQSLDMSNTIIVYASDHGENLGERGFYFKSNFFEDSVKVPLIISSPDHLKNIRVDENISLLDLYPTFADLAGNNQALDVFGQSLLSALEEGSVADDNRAIISQLGMTRGIGSSAMIRKGDYKLISYSDIGENQLFNLKEDPDELVNLIHEGFEEVASELEYELYSKWNPEEMNAISKKAIANSKILKEWTLKVGKKLESQWTCDADKNHVL